MYLYTESARFNPLTGKPCEPVLIKDPNRAICDYTGEIIDLQDPVSTSIYNIAIDYNCDSEPVWYEEANEFDREFKIGYGDFGQFMSSPYHFRHVEVYGSADITVHMCNVWLTALRSKKDKKNPLKMCGTIDQVFCHFRLETLRTLLRNKIYTLEQLGFIHMSDE